MRKFLVGLAAGLTMGAAGAASAAQLIGRTGYLAGWTVTKGGEELCSMPYVWTASREIECE